MGQVRGYPEYWEADVVLRDGVTAHIRPITPEDAPGVEQFHLGQSETSIYYRFFTYKSTLTPKELERFTNVDYRDRVAFVITAGGHIIGIGRYDRLNNPTEAEVAFNIADAHQGRGLGSILLEHLAAAALENGITRFSAEVLPENRKMLSVFSDAGYEIQRSFDDGVIAVHFDIDPTAKSLAVMEAREHRAEARSVAEVLRPQRVAVVGVSKSPTTMGRMVFNHIRDAGFTGTVYGVNARLAAADPEQRLYPRLSDLPENVDLVVIAVPNRNVHEVIAECAGKSVKGLLVLSAGYADDGDAGLERQRHLVREARKNGMRVLGPASLGISNTDPEIMLNASPAPQLPKRGRVGVFTQSAALGSLLFASAARRAVGISTAVSAGNRADISGNDLMQYWEDDPNTSVVGMYLESIGNPRKFSRIARRLALTKPVIVAKSDVMGLQLPPGHVVRTTQAPAGALDAMMRQSGVIRVKSNDELVDIAMVLASQPVPLGSHIAVLSNSLALGKVVADNASAWNLTPTVLTANLNLSGNTERITSQLSKAVTEVLSGTQADAAVVTLIPTPGVATDTLAATIYNAARAAGKPVVASFAGVMDQSLEASGLVSGPDFDPAPEGLDQGLPCYSSPGAAVRALGAATRYGMWRAHDHGEYLEPEGIRDEDATRLLENWMKDVNGAQLLTLDSEESVQLLASYGVRALRTIKVSTAQEAVAAAHLLGWPVALKSTDAYLRRRLDLGGVRLNLGNPVQLAEAVDSMKEELRAYGRSGMEVQAMAEPGQACVIRAMEDPLLGPVISFGMAGDATQILDDWAHRITPLTTQDVADMVRQPRAAIKLAGHQESFAVDKGALEDVLMRIAVLKDRHPEIASISIDPLLVHRDAVALSATIMLGNPEQRTDSARRAMRD